MSLWAEQAEIVQSSEVTEPACYKLWSGFEHVRLRLSVLLWILACSTKLAEMSSFWWHEKKKKKRLNFLIILS